MINSFCDVRGDVRRLCRALLTVSHMRRSAYGGFGQAFAARQANSALEICQHERLKQKTPSARYESALTRVPTLLQLSVKRSSTESPTDAMAASASHVMFQRPEVLRTTP